MSCVLGVHQHCGAGRATAAAEHPGTVRRVPAARPGRARAADRRVHGAVRRGAGEAARKEGPETAGVEVSAGLRRAGGPALRRAAQSAVAAVRVQRRRHGGQQVDGQRRGVPGAAGPRGRPAQSERAGRRVAAVRLSASGRRSGPRRPQRATAGPVPAGKHRFVGRGDM